MSQQGERPTDRPVHEDDWWGQLYDEDAADTGSSPAADSLDDRFASAGALTTPGAAVPPARRPAPDAPAARREPAAAPPPEPAGTGHATGTAHLGPVTAGPAEAVPVVVPYVGDGPPTYDAEPTALPAADPDELEDLVADTVLDGARYGSSTLRAASVRGDSARFRGEPRRDSLLTARFGSGPGALILVAMATGARATPGAHRAAAEACDWIGRAVGLSHARLAEDIRAGRRGDLKSGLHRLTDRSLGKLRAGAAEQGLDPDEYSATLRCLLVPADPECRTRVFFGVGGGGLFRLRDGAWQDIEPSVVEQSGAPVVGYGSLPAAETPEGDRLTMDLGITTPPSPYEPAPEPLRDPFRFRASVARPGDVLLVCTAGLAEPLRGEPQLARHLAARWAKAEPPGLAAFLADTQVRVKGYADDRTAAAVWEA
ncbi:protein phosphatase 2C domain-containing protein [Streptomyces sp. NPDC050400]|uniref:protein phosphatase 2C domain-containing protein n=1 Tax=Streptomyces sp. NPDC050400 TaxID=3365610 RepID=UPI00378A30E1